MIPWIMIYTNLLSHPKTGRLVDTLGLKSPNVEPEVIAAGMLVSLWTWAAQNAYHGDLSACSDRTIAKACAWKKDPQKLVQALQECGWMDGKQLHDWEEYAELYISAQENQREKTRERVRRFRNKQKSVTDDYSVTERNGYGNVTDTLCNGATEQYSTVHNNTSLLSKERKERKKERAPEETPEEWAARVKAEMPRREDYASDEEYQNALIYGKDNQQATGIDWSKYQLVHPGVPIYK